MVRLSAMKKNSAMNFRVQRLHAPAEYLRPARQLGNIAHGDSGIAQQPGRSARRHDLDFHRRKLACEFHDPRLVIHTDQRPLNCHEKVLRTKWPVSVITRAEFRKGTDV